MKISKTTQPQFISAKTKATLNQDKKDKKESEYLF